MYIGVLNLGLKSMRAAVFDLSGQRRAIAYRPIETQMGEGRVEQSPSSWWSAAREVLTEVLSDASVAQGLEVITVTASAGCLVPIASDGNALGNAIMISDVRARDQAELISRLAIFQEHARLARRVTPDLMLPKILWLKQHEPERYAAARWYGTPNDYLIGRLTGRIVTDRYNATKYFYDLEGSGYPIDLLEALDLLSDRLPPVVNGNDSVLPLLPELRDALRLRPDVRVVLSTYDAMCAVYGAGASNVGDACDVSGTVTSYRAVTDLRLRDPSGRLFVAPHVRDGLYLAGGSNNLGGGVIEWAKQLLYADERDPYAAMAAEAYEAPPGAAGITFLPYLLGERAPIWNPNARAVFFGLGRNHERGDLIRAVFEGVAYSVLDIASRLKELGVDTARAYASGGLAKIAPIQQIKADMLGVPVQLTAELETTALGAAIVAGVNLGCYASIEEATSSTVRFGRSFEPDRARNEMYRDFFGIYRKMYSQLSSLFEERAELITRHAEVLRTVPSWTENL